MCEGGGGQVIELNLVIGIPIFLDDDQHIRILSISRGDIFFKSYH